MINSRESSIMPTESILQLLENGKWHYLKELTEKTCLNRYKVENVTKFLAKYNFVKLDEAEQKVKLDSPTIRFLKRIRQLENEENV
jgi:DNA-binding IclR family transcriptional regulator